MLPFKKLFPLYVLIFFGYLGYSLFITIFTPLFLKEETGFFPENTPDGLKVLALGFTLFLYPFGQFLSSPILGSFSDRFGRRRILLVSLLISALVYSLIGIAVWIQSLILLNFSLFAAGLAEGNLTIAQSSISDTAKKKELSRLFGYIYVATSLSYVIGPILGGQLSDAKNLYIFSFKTPFFIVSFLLFIMFLWIFFIFKETLLLHKRNNVSFFNAMTNIKNLFLIKKVRLIFLSNFLIYTSIFGFLQTFPIYIVNKFSLNVEQLSLFIAWTSVPFFVVNIWFTGHFAKTYSALRITIFSSILLGFFQGIFLFPQTQATIWVVLFLLGSTTAIILPISSVLISHSAKETEQGKILGINQSLQFFSEAIAGLFIGFLGSIFIKLSFIFFGVIAILGGLILWLYKTQSPSID